MNEEQLKLFIRHAFALENTAARIVKDSSPELAQAMARIRVLVKRLPPESLMQEAAWRKMLDQVAAELKPYNDALANSVLKQLRAEAPEMADFAEGMIRSIKVPPPPGAVSDLPIEGVPLPMQSLKRPPVLDLGLALLETRVNGRRLPELFAADADPIRASMGPWIKSNLKVIDRTVKTGIMRGLSTEEIADSLAVQMVTKGGEEVLAFQGPTAARQIRSQAKALARTAVQDFNAQVNQSVYAANPLSDSLAWEWVSALDSRTCVRCAPLDAKTRQKRKDFPATPLHINCRCMVVVVDPDDPGQVRTGTMIAPTEAGLTKGKPYKSQVYVKGEKFYRSTIIVKDKQGKAVKKPSYGDFLVSSNEVSRAEFFGGGELGRNRASKFMVLVRSGNSPETALDKLITISDGERTFKVDLSSITPD